MARTIEKAKIGTGPVPKVVLKKLKTEKDQDELRQRRKERQKKKEEKKTKKKEEKKTKKAGSEILRNPMDYQDSFRSF